MTYIRKWELHFKSDPEKIRKIVRDILRYLDEALPGQSVEERGDLKLIFSELLINAVIHGNRKDRGKYVYIEVAVNADRIQATIRDEGTGYDYETLMERLSRGGDLDKENGRGLLLVLALADEVYFNSAGNQIRFVKHIGKSHP